MIPVLDPKAHLPPLYREFLDALVARGFRGDVHTDYASRIVTATDNSVYQIVPVAVVFPRDEADVVHLLTLLGDARFGEVKVSPRGGGTGTNGQALSDGVVVDVSRHMAKILETNLEEGWVRVQPGVVLDQLNAHLKPHGVFFAPNLSPSNRATIGGMIATDASGKGSRVYGKTSHHVNELRAVLVDGTVLASRPLDAAELVEAKGRHDLAGAIYRAVDDIVTRNAEKIATTLPKLERFLTGYDLAHVKKDGRFDLTSVICGSEGTLAFVTEATLRLTKLPKHRQLVAIRYAEFDAALRAANVLVREGPGAIETIDDMIVGLAKKDAIWHTVAHLVTQEPTERPLAAINLVEFESDDPEVVTRKIEALCKTLDAETNVEGYTVVRDPKDIAAAWSLRKKGVGLLGNVKGDRRPIPFVEDTAVPPDKLADYIRDFRKLLDRHQLRYGMFGHVDVGCLHVRPALDLKNPEDEKLFKTISDEVVALVKSYGGVLWGEHGKGVRGAYAPVFFGPELYAELRKVKGAFDPKNQLNPGKLATPPDSNDRILGIDTLMRGKLDRQIHPETRAKYDVAVHCNGNGACFDWNPDTVMCPSYLGTRDRVHSPKGRAGIMREWLRLLARQGHDGGATRPVETGFGIHARARREDDFSHQVYDAMNGCLACKACATQCPVKVDVPTFRAEFLAQYHARYRRPLKDYFVAILETVLVVMGVFPSVFNAMMRLSKGLLAKWIGIVDSPALAEATLASGLRARKAPAFDPKKLAALSAEERAKTVLVAQDAFTTFYEPNVALAAYDVLTRLGRRVVFLPFRENGKGLHVKGFLGWFADVAAKNAAMLKEAAALGIPIVGLEPAVTLTYRDEYRHALGDTGFEVKLLQEYLGGLITELEALPKKTKSLRLFGHCTERTAEPASQGHWVRVFGAMGVDVKIADVGCCGMCGVYGHEAEHVDESRVIFEGSWKRALPVKPDGIVVTGHSCRSQTKRFGGFLAQHPVEALRDLLGDGR